MSFRVFCDLCKQELKRNMVSERLIVESGGFRAKVVIDKKGIEDDGDLCYTCLLKMLNTGNMIMEKALNHITDIHFALYPSSWGRLQCNIETVDGKRYSSWSGIPNSKISLELLIEALELATQQVERE